MASGYGDGLDAGSPNSDGPGNAAWQAVRRQLAVVQSEEEARRRRN